MVWPSLSTVLRVAETSSLARRKESYWMLRTSFRSNSLEGGVNGLPFSACRKTRMLSRKDRARQKRISRMKILHGARMTKLTAFRFPFSSCYKRMLVCTINIMREINIVDTL